MLLFIAIKERYIRMQESFQNIVCYCLSLTDLLVKGKKNDFKTSYVTVYLLDITVKRI